MNLWRVWLRSSSGKREIAIWEKYRRSHPWEWHPEFGCMAIELERLWDYLPDLIPAVDSRWERIV